MTDSNEVKKNHDAAHRGNPAAELCLCPYMDEYCRI